MRITEIIFEDYKTTAAKFATQGGKEDEISSQISRYREMLARNQIKDINQKQIDWWAKQGWPAFNSFVAGFEGHVTPTQTKRRKVVGDSVILKENDDWLVVIPLNKEASCFYGKHSSWCTTKPTEPHWEDYFHGNKITLIYAIGKLNQGMWALAIHPDGDIEVFDQLDKRHDVAAFEAATNLSVSHLINTAEKLYGRKIKQAQQNPEEVVEEWLKGSSTDRSTEIEKAVLKTNEPVMAIQYMRKVLPSADSHTWPDKLVELALTVYVPSDQQTDDEEWEDPRDDQQYKWGKTIALILSHTDYVPKSVEKIIWQYKPELSISLKNPSHDFIQQISIRSSAAFKHFYKKDQLDNETILKSVASYPARLDVIDNPSDEIYLAALKNKSGPIVYDIVRKIKNPSSEIQAYAVQRDPRVITTISNPTKEAILSAVSKEPNLMGSLDPKLVDTDVLKAAFKKSWISSQYLPKNSNLEPIKLPPSAQIELAKSFFKDYLSRNDQNDRGHRISLLKYHYPVIDNMMTDPRAKNFLSALRKKYEKD